MPSCLEPISWVRWVVVDSAAFFSLDAVCCVWHLQRGSIHFVHTVVIPPKEQAVSALPMKRSNERDTGPQEVCKPREAHSQRDQRKFKAARCISYGLDQCCPLKYTRACLARPSSLTMNGVAGEPWLGVCSPCSPLVSDVLRTEWKNGKGLVTSGPSSLTFNMSSVS